MLKNYLKIAWRSLTKNKLQTFINLLGLTVGTVCCLSILAYVNAQFGYDTHHENASDLYRVRTKNKSIKNNSIDSDFGTASPPIAFALKEDFPEVSEVCRIVYFGEGNEQLLRASDSNDGYYEPRGYVADSTFFKLFSYPLLEGNGNEALKAPNSMVLSSALAKKLFGKEKALNKTLVLGAGEQQLDITVTGVFKEDANKTHLNPNYILSMTSPGIGAFVRRVQNYATQNFVHSYLKLVPGSDASEMEKKLPDFLQARGSKDLAAAGFDKTLLLQPMKDIHLYSKGIEMQIDAVSNIEYLYAMLLLALIIQLVACINFVNLSTARASKRAKEIGVRKTVGAEKGSLIRQFLGESVLLSLFAVIISIPLTISLLPFMNALTEGNLVFWDVLNFKIMALLLGVGVVTGLLAGFYPALILSAIKPVKVLKGIIDIQSGNGNFRRALVVFQFVVSIALVTAVIIVTQQLKYAQTKEMGFDRENLLAVRLGTQDARGKFDAIQSQMASVSGVSQVAGTNNYPSALIMGDMGMHLPGMDDTNQTGVFYNGITENYFNAVGTKLLAGRPLRKNDSTQVIVNKATLDEFNIKLEDAMASKLIQTYEGQSSTYEIVGVAENYHFATLKSAIDPILLYNDTSPDWVVLKTETRDFKTLLTNLEHTWKSINPDTPFVYTFIDKEVEKLFAEEKRLGQISMVFTLLAILISCLGLFGLVSYVAEQKKKEIGIRKVLGASINSVVQLLTKDFLKLVGIAFLIGSPIAYYFMQRWLEGFTYKIEIEFWVFILAGGFALLITLLTVGFQSIKSAIANPVKSLRTE
jgi:putative ABC transport system permease protein